MTDRITFKNTSLLSGLSLAATLLMATSASAHFIGVGGNNSIDGSLCVGNDCVAEEAFGFDTIRLKENNLRIHFEDTSVSASFPPNDWRIRINDSANGGASYFAVEDATSGNTPFRVTAGARNNALFVDSQGDVGIGTSTPATDIDIKIGDSPTVRLQQDGTSGFTPQSWDLAGNETNFFIRDVTNGSLLPFRIRPEAPTNSLMIDDTGDIGMGTASPAYSLEITSGTASDNIILTLENTNTGTPGATQYRMHSDLETNRRIVSAGADGTPDTQIAMTNTEIKLFGTDFANPWLNVSAAGIVTNAGGTCDPGPCDGTFDPEIFEVETIEEHAAFMWENKYLWGVGPTPEGQPYNLSTKTTGILHELEKAHIYIEQLHNRLQILEERLNDKI